MARKGENIYKRKDGRWEARYEKGRNSKGQIIYGSLYGKSYREVREKKINSIVKLPVAKTISPSESMNICDVSTRWLESIRHTVKESTYSCYLTLIQKHILTYFNNNLIITSEHIQQFINYKITNDLSPASVRNIVVEEPQKGAGKAVQSGTGKTEEGKEERRNGTVSKVKFNADEMMVMAMFEQPTRTETMRYIEEVVPFVEDDVEVFSLVASTMKKMRSISDMEFSRLDLKPYLQDVVAK